MDSWTAQETRRWLRHRRVAGTLEAIVGVAALGLFGVLFRRHDGLVLNDVLIAAVGLAAVVIGVAFVFGQAWARVILWPLSVVHLVVFPVGTVIGAYVLWVLYNTRRPPATPTPTSRNAVA